MKKEIGIGFVGAGENTRLRHLPGFAAIEGVRLVTVANRSKASSEAVATDFKIGRISPGWRAVVDDPEVDAICIGTWPYLHAEVALAALEAGKHVLTEARMAADLKSAQAMLVASEAHPQLVAQIVPSPFTLDLDQTVTGMINRGDLGEIREVFIDHATSACLDPKSPLGWRQDPKYSGINMLTLGIYHEVIQRWFSGAMEVSAVNAAMFTKQRRHWESGELVPVQLPEVLHILGTIERSTLLNYHFSGVESGPPRNEIRLTGSKGSLCVDVARQTLTQTLGGAASIIEIPDAARRGWCVETDFVDSVLTGKPVKLTSFAEGVRYMAFTEAVFSGIQEG